MTPSSLDTDASGSSIAPRLLASMLCVLACGVALSRYVFAQTEPPPDPRDVQIRERQEQVVAAFSAPETRAEPNHRLVIAFGSSYVEVGLSPQQIDAHCASRGVPTTTFNFGVAASTPNLIRLITHRAAKAFAVRGVQADVAYLELTPQMATRTTARQDPGNVNAARLAPLLDPGEAWRIAWRSPRLATIDGGSWVLGWPSADAPANAIAAKLLGPGSGPRRARDPNVERKMKELAGSPVGKAMVERHKSARPWDPQVRGEQFYLRMPEETEVARAMDDVLRDVMDARMYPGLVRDFDFDDLDFDPESIDDVIGAYEELRKVSRKVFVLLMPRRPKHPLSRTGAARLEAQLEQLRARGMPVVSYFQSPEFSDEDFNDAVHLSRTTGRSKLSERLAEHVVSVVQTDR